MHKFKIIIIAIFSHFSIFGQFSDDFSSGNIDTWQGQQDDFIINGNDALQLNASEAGQSILYHAVSFPDSLNWSFDVQLRFSPSSNNNLIVLLAVDNVDLLLANGYILKMGESGSDDAIHLVRLDNGIETIIGSGPLGFISSSFNLKINLTKSGSDNWSLFTESVSDGNLTTQLDINFGDDIIMSQQFFGCICNYTSSNADNFIFDNIIINEILADTEAPQLVKLEVLDNNRIQLDFNEPLDETSATELSNYILTPSIEIGSILFDPTSMSSLALILSESLSGCDNSQITIQNIQDISGNISAPITETFSIIESPQVGDLLINELLSDPISNGVDYIEIINVSGKTMSLKNLIIRNDDRDDEDIIEENIILEADDIIAFTPTEFNILLNYSPPIDANIVEHPIPGFNNTDGNASLILLQNTERIIIDSYDYNDDQHDASLSSTDGVSFERISTIESTNTFSNWSSALETTNFGTPGYKNSIAIQTLEKINVSIINEQEIEVRFLTAINLDLALDVSNYDIDGISISDIIADNDNPKKVILFLNNGIESGEVYTLSIDKMETDCGEPIDAHEFELRLIEDAEVGDLLINEILFNPYKDQSDFLEIINVSQKFIRLDNLIILNSQSGNLNPIVLGGFMEPNQILAMTENPDIVVEQYDPPAEANIVSQNLPAFNDSDGNISLQVETMGNISTIDFFDYDENYHFDLLRENEGVSLERISTISETNDPSNWFSSAESNNFATPGYRNSAQLIQSNPADGEIFLEYQTFSPNGDSDKDILFLNYALNKPGYVANVNVYDDSGRFKRQIANNELLSSDGFIRWDGIKADGQLAPIGMYIIQYEFFHPDGDVINGKKVCVLAQFLD
ncbi:MAG: hypothetical protein KJN84_10525 [Bacteroidia bacterium]|nr:hypothetical protein [Bacteroidia bacterium]